MKNKKNLYRSLFTFIIIILTTVEVSSQWNPNYSVGTVTGKYVFNYNEVPDNLVEIYPAVTGGGSVNYQWYQCLTPGGVFTAVPGATNSGYSFSTQLTQTTYFKCRVTDNSFSTTYSNTLKIEVGSVNWEDLNYVREHDVLVPGITDWKAVDQLQVGDKLQTTTYLDGLGRPIQKVSRETATPAQSGGLWGDMVQFSEYDTYGREVKQYLPYTTTIESGTYKTTPLATQTSYYSSIYNETAAYSATTFENSPLNRIVNVKSPGTTWAMSTGNSAVYDLNETVENVQMFDIGYTSGAWPTNRGAYPPNTLFKTTHADENGKLVIEYTNNLGQVILTKTQIEDNPSPAHAGWICVYSIYDDFGLLRYRLQPEAVKYLDEHAWLFMGYNGLKIRNELSFHYDYDEKGRNIIKKAPGAKELHMVYDDRDRVVFMQDGNQSVKSPPEWTANLYDELDRPIITTLYHTTATVATLQANIDNSVTVTPVNIANPNVNVTDLSISNRDNTISRYAAQNSIEFTDGFISDDNDNFVAEIDAAAVTQGYTVNTYTYKSPISGADLNNPFVSTIVKYQFYDDYSFNSVKAFDNNFDNTTAYSNFMPGVMPITPSPRTISYPTGSMVRVLGTNTFLASTEYYDEKGRHIQSIEDNIKNGKDVTTLQYNWDGRMMSTHTKHTTADGYNNFGILTKNLFDKIGRVSSVQKKYGNNAFKTIASYDFDDVGRLKTKHLDPGYTGSGKNELEGLTYSYNIHDNITGINKDYALKVPGYNKWGNFFGLCLGYDKDEGVFSTGSKQLDGHVGGIIWNTQGDDAQRKYEYIYDNAGRLTKATFNERLITGTAWDNSKMNFSVCGNGTGNKIEYSLNGNLLSMVQKGVMPGSQSPVTIDNLSYTYQTNTNKLISVTDNGTLGNDNGSFGDFKDGSNTIDNDYVYDDNGNLVIDLNKNAKELGNVAGANGIRYNFLDKPEEIHISGKGTIQLVYDAEGNKLQKKYTPEGSTTTKTTTYINQFVYEGSDLQYINFEEGRIRVIQPTSQSNGYDVTAIDGNMDLPNGKKGAYDYYLRDYQENVRMILTEESHYSLGKCTMETGRAGNEEPVFGQVGAGNEVAARFTKPPGWNSNTSSSVSKLSKAIGKVIGPNSLLKVMAGDEISASSDYYYAGIVNNNNNSFVSDVVNNLVGAISGSNVTSAVTKNGAAAIGTNLNGSVPFSNITDPHKNTTDNYPRAYLTVLFFDERFNFVEEGSAFERTMQSGDGAAPLVLANIKAPKNGYAYIYVSNESDEPVYFDNLQVADNRGRIIEENHYYAFGLKIAGISSTKLGDANEGLLKNQNLYNDKELMDEADLNWYDLGYRNYDPQTGRFLQIDPLTDHFPDFSTYSFAGDEPIANIDVGGLAPLPGLSGTFANLGEVIVKAAPRAAQVAKTGLSAARIGSIAIKTADIVTDFIPLVSGGKDIYKGIRDGNGWQVALGVGSIALDIFTFGGSSVAKGIVKTGIREGVEMVAREEAKEFISKGIVKELPKFGCFVKGTPVWTAADSTKAIEKIRVGDYVHAYDINKKQVVKKKVTKAYIREVNQLVKIDYGGEVIYTTTEHPFYINNSWAKAGELKAADSLFVKNGKIKIPVQRITVIDTVVTVYNITVADAHDYYVGRSKVLVHNNPCAQVFKVGKSLTELGLKDGMKVSSSRALELGEEFLGKGYKEIGKNSGRYVSADGKRVFRMGANDILGKHAGAPHVNFETLIPNPAKSGKMMVDQNLHVFLNP